MFIDKFYLTSLIFLANPCFIIGKESKSSANVLGNERKKRLIRNKWFNNETSNTLYRLQLAKDKSFFTRVLI